MLYFVFYCVANHTLYSNIFNCFFKIALMQAGNVHDGNTNKWRRVNMTLKGLNLNRRMTLTSQTK